MDGNGRWATSAACPQCRHIEAQAVRKVVEVAPRAVDTLTIYASPPQLGPPLDRGIGLMRLFGQYLFTETRRCVEQSIRST